MSWAAYLDHVEVVEARVQRALSSGDVLAATAAVAELDDERASLPPLPVEVAVRARRAVGQLASLDAAIRAAMARLEPELSLLDRARPAGSPSQYVDTSA